ncbi:MAG: hypothetical protein HDT27_07420 [Subdoligranulum sp.]|nr:hypothetical protein [Subdoligranulum sp.]
MKKVLWISRHEMTPAQRADLERVMNGPVELLLWRDTVRQAAELAPAIAESDAVAAVLPPELLCEVLYLAGGKPVMQSLSARRPTGRTVSMPDGRRDPEFAFVHAGWQQIVRMELETRML